MTKHASSVQLTVDAARSTATRVGSSYAISGSGVNTTDGTTAGMLSAGTITSGLLAPGIFQQHKQLTVMLSPTVTSFTQGDALPTSAATVGDNPNFSSLTSTPQELLVT